MTEELGSPGAPWTRFEVTREEIADRDAILWHIAGNFTDCHEAFEFLNEFRTEAARGSGPLILDMRQLHHLTSCGAGIIAACAVSSSNAGRSLAVVGLSARADAVMTVVGLKKAVPTFDTTEDALRGLSH
jgi:anti-anti-sigma factor